MQAAKKVAINTGFLYARMGITVFISLYATRLVLGALGTTDFGIFNLVGGAIALFGFFNASMAAATQRFMSYAQGEGSINKLKQIFNVSIVLHVILAGFVFIALEITGYIFFDRILNISPERIYAAKLVYQFMIVSAIFTVISVPYDAVINSHENMLLFAILGIIESISKLGIALYILDSTYDKLILYGLLAAMLSVVLLLFRIFYCNRKYRECTINFKSHYELNLMKDMSKFAGWSLLGTSSSMVANYGQGIVLNIFFGTVVNAAQGIANQVSGQLGAFASTMLRALNPLITKSEGAGDRELMIKASIIGSKISFFLLMIFLVPAIVEMPFILKLWLSEVPPFAIIFCQMLLIRNLIEQLFYTLNASISAVGKIKKYQIYSSLLTFLPLPISYLLFENGYPPYYLYLIFLIYSVLASILILYYSNIYFGLSIFKYMSEVVGRCVVTFIISIAFSFVPTLYMEEGLYRLLTVGFISFISFILSAWAIGLTLNERISLKQILLNVTILIKNKKRQLPSIAK